MLPLHRGHLVVDVVDHVAQLADPGVQALALDRLSGEHLLEGLVVLGVVFQGIRQEVGLLDDSQEQRAELLHVGVEQLADLRAQIGTANQVLAKAVDAFLAHEAVVADALRPG